MSKFVVGDQVLLALYEAGVIGDDYTSIRRVVIDLEVSLPARIYIEKYGDDSMIPVLAAGITVVETEEEAGLTTGMSLP